jgi:flagellar FliL protein
MAESPAEASTEKPKPKGGGIVGIAINAVGVFVLALGAVIVGGFVNAKLHPVQEFIQTPGPDSKLMLKPPPPPPADKKEGGGEEHEDKGGPSKPAVYFAFDPPLIVNFDDTQAVRFLQLTIEVLTRDEKYVEAVKLHQPMIRNNLLMLMNGRDYKTLMTREGKEALRLECLKEVQRILKKETGSTAVEDLYFTSFVVQ